MSQASTVARLATRELWMTFRLLLVLIVSVGAGAVIGLLPARLPETMARLAAGLGLAIAVAAAVAAWSLAEERISGRAGWLVTRSVARSTYLAGWYLALVLVPAIGLAVGALLGWLAIPGGAATVSPVEYLAVILAVATTLGAAVAIGLLAGSILRPPAAMIVTLLVCAGAAALTLGMQEAAAWLPGGALLLLARVAGSDPVTADALRAAGIGLGLTAVVLVACRLALERTEPLRIHPVAAWAALGFASLGVLLGGAELMVVAIALPSIVADFGGWEDLGRVSWIVNAYLLAYIVAMPLAGRGADLWGAMRLYVVALLLFVIGSAGAGLARMAGPEDGLTWLIVARVVQGFGGGALVPLSMAVASHLFTGRARAFALGVEGAAVYVGMAIGPAYGAWVLLNFSLPIPGLDIAPWQWIFLLNVPIGIVTLLLIYVFAGGIETPRAQGRLDLVGALVLTVALGAGIGAITVSGELGWTDPLVLGGLLLSAASFAAFVWLQLRSRSPLIDLRLFADRAFSAANLVSLLTGYTLATAVIGGPVFVNRVLFGTDAESAAALTALTLAIAVGALAGGVAAGFLGERIVTVLGVAASAVGLWFAAGWGVETDLGRLVRDLAIFGVGFGLTVSPRATAAVEAAGAGAYGVASAMLQVTRTIGMSIGLALLTSIGQNRIDELSALITDDTLRDRLVVQLGKPEFVGVDPNASLALVAVLEEWSQGEAAGVLRLIFGIALGVAVVTLIPAYFVRGRARLPEEAPPI